MQTQNYRTSKSVWNGAVVLALVMGCGNSNSDNPVGKDGSVVTGGAVATGGGGGTSGALTNGATGGKGGTVVTGGMVLPGGNTGTGGATGGVVMTGGGVITGGTVGTGGSSITGGVASGGGAGGTSGSGGVTTTCGNGTPGANDIVVDLAKGEQVMDGFGVSNALQNSAISDAVADQIFDKTKGIGLSIFRLGINTGGDSSGSWSDAVKAAARGAVIWAAPWSPPANCKTNGSTKNGGHLKTECYESWANTLAGFVAKGKSHNVEIMGISVQNEADNVVPYDSCIYTAAEMIAFVKVLSPKLRALSPPVKLIAPESTRWERLWTGEWNYGNAILADKDAADMVDVLATHMYENQIAHAPPAGVTKHIWQTEMSGIENYPEHGPSADIANGIASAKWVHDGIAVGRASAWHWWWIHPAYANDNEGLYLKGGAITKRLFTFGNFTKFIRPGYQRVGITGTLPTDVLMTAYKNPSDGTMVMVAINSSKTATPISIFISGGAPCQMTPWVTSSTEDLKESTSKLSITDGKLSAMLAAQSVTTFVGKP